MKASDIFTTVLKTFYPGGMIKTYKKYVADCAGYTISGDSKSEVQKAMVEEIHAMFKYGYTRRYIPLGGGDPNQFLCFYRLPGGWGYDIIRNGHVTGSARISGGFFEAFRRANQDARSMNEKS